MTLRAPAASARLRLPTRVETVDGRDPGNPTAADAGPRAAVPAVPPVVVLVAGAGPQAVPRPAVWAAVAFDVILRYRDSAWLRGTRRAPPQRDLFDLG